MTTLAIQSEQTGAGGLPSAYCPVPNASLLKPEPRLGPISIRPAVLQGADVMFIDALQKKHAKMVGFMPKDQLEKNIDKGKVLIAQDPETTARIGYCIFNDKYFKREDLGIVYHLNIVPDKQRGLVGAALVKAAFEACPWGVKLFCCWCAQDLAACHFWESIGFVPIAFRAGSRGKEHGGRRKEGRMQIFWQRRIREGDETTPYWYPTETSAGAMKENRIVLPIPPGKHWSDELPFVLPGVEALSNEPRALASGAEGGAHNPLPNGRGSSGTRTRKPKPAAPPPARPKRGLWFAAAGPTSNDTDAKPAEQPADQPKPKREKPPRPPKRNDPKLIAAAREWRDRYLDEVNSGRFLLASAGKYDVSRQLEAAPSAMRQRPLLKAA